MLNMKLTKDEIIEYRQKKAFVKRLGEVCKDFDLRVLKSELDVFFDSKGCLREFMVVTYKGGAIAVRDCAINSNLANLCEFTKLMHGGYYEEVQPYKDLKEEGFIAIPTLKEEGENN